MKPRCVPCCEEDDTVIRHTKLGNVTVKCTRCGNWFMLSKEDVTLDPSMLCEFKEDVAREKRKGKVTRQYVVNVSQGQGDSLNA